MRPTVEACLGDTPRYTPRCACECHLGSNPGFLTHVEQKRMYISFSFGVIVELKKFSSGDVPLC